MKTIEVPVEGLRLVCPINGVEVVVKPDYHDQGMGHGMNSISVFPPSEKQSTKAVDKGGYLMVVVSDTPLASYPKLF